MLELFSAQKRIETWRRLWVALARAEHELGLAVTEQQVAELEEHLTDIDFEAAAKREKEVRHDVMADFLFPLCGQIKVDIPDMVLQRLYLVFRNGQAQFHLRPGQLCPQLSPGADPGAAGEELQHIPAGIPG